MEDIDKKFSAITDLSEDRLFHLTLIAMLLEELIVEQIITPSQKNEIKSYLLKKLEAKK